jgi:hypothetical protein
VTGLPPMLLLFHDWQRCQGWCQRRLQSQLSAESGHSPYADISLIHLVQMMLVNPQCLASSQFRPPSTILDTRRMSARSIKTWRQHLLQRFYPALVCVGIVIALHWRASELQFRTSSYACLTYLIDKEMNNFKLMNRRRLISNLRMRQNVKEMPLPWGIS